MVKEVELREFNRKKYKYESLPEPSLRAQLKSARAYVQSDSSKNKKAVIIGVITVFLVVFFVSYIQNAINKSPVIFLKLAENQVGEPDIVVAPSPTNGISLTAGFDISSLTMNFTEMEELIQGNENIVGMSPRWIFLADLINPIYPGTPASAIMLILDSKRENAMGLGRDWPHRPLGPDEVHITSSVLRRIGLNPNEGEQIQLTVDFLDVLSQTGAFPGSPEQFLADLIEQSLGVNLAQDLTLQQLVNGLGNGAIVDGLLGLFGVNSTDDIPNIDVGNNSTGILNTAFTTIRNALILQRNYTVIDGIDSPAGKYSGALGNVIILESQYFEAIVGDLVSGFVDTLSGLGLDNDLLSNVTVDLPPPFDTSVSLSNLTATLENFRDNFRLDDIALTAVVMMKGREDVYKKDQEGLNEGLIFFTNELSESLGFDYPVSFTTPLSASLATFYFIRLFLDQIFLFVYVILIQLGGLLIYSLMISDVEAKTYEYGMLRALGMRHSNLIQILVTQAMYFAIPGIILGAVVSWIVYIPLAYILSSYTILPADLVFDPTAMIVAAVLGLLMPIVANIIPIQRALSGTLRDALDIYHSTTSDTVVKIIKLENLGLSPLQISFSVMVVVMGFIVYYLIPYTFQFGQISLFFVILTFILLGMLVGLTLITTTVQPFVERMMLSLIIHGTDRRTTKDLIKKNLAAHASRNMKTAIMFSTSLAFIIFAGLVFDLLGHNISETVQLGAGTDIVIFAPSINVPLDEDPLREYLNTELQQPQTILEGFSFVSFPLDDYEFIPDTEISNLAGYPLLDINVYAVEEFYLDETYDRFWSITEVDTNFNYEQTRSNSDDTIKSLYDDAGNALLPEETEGILIPEGITSRGLAETVDNSTAQPISFSVQESYSEYIDVIISEAMRFTASVDIETPLELKFTYLLSESDRNTFVVLAKPKSMVDRVPGFFFSAYRQSARFSPVIITSTQYQRILDLVYDAAPRSVPKLTSVPKQKLMLKTKENASVFEREGLINSVRNFLGGDLENIVVDTQDLVDDTKVATDLLDIFFIVVAAISITLSFCVLYLSFTANVNDNSWQFGVLRSLGLPANTVIRIYIYEALSVVLASILLGTLVGAAMATTLTLQFNLFLQLPFYFNFPFPLFFGVVLMSVVVSVVGSYLPASKFKKKATALTLKGL